MLNLHIITSSYHNEEFYTGNISFVFLSNRANSQNKIVHSIQEAIDIEIAKVKSRFRHIDNIFINTRIDTNLRLPEHAFKIENSMDGKFLRKSDNNFVIYLTIHSQSSQLIIDAGSARVIKISNRKIKIVYFYDGERYLIE